MFELEPVFKRMNEDSEKYGPMEPGMQQVFILNDCVVVVGLEEEPNGDNKISINIIGGSPAVINHSTGFYNEPKEAYKEVLEEMVVAFGRRAVQEALDEVS